MAGVPGVFCFEGDWEDRLDDSKSVLPLLEAAQRIIGMPFIHRTIGTTEELNYYIGKWLQPQHARYTIGHFAFHGNEEGIGIGDTGLDLDDLATTIKNTENRAAGRIIYFDSCSVLADNPTAEEFLHDTRAEAVIGYSKDTHWMEGAAFDLLLFYALGDEDNPANAKDWLMDEYPKLSERLGLRFLLPDKRNTS